RRGSKKPPSHGKLPVYHAPIRQLPDGPTPSAGAVAPFWTWAMTVPWAVTALPIAVMMSQHHAVVLVNRTDRPMSLLDRPAPLLRPVAEDQVIDTEPPVPPRVSVPCPDLGSR